ncbi:MAG: hypothetical protein EOO60_02935 [Hymenobacter sp.]|nr:MAG: hypothetical protein EOO60_02935 [Hymenobacter sp.]
MFINAVLSWERTSIAWRELPKHCGNCKTVPLAGT